MTIPAVFPSGGNKWGQLAQASFSHFHSGTGGEKNCSKGITSAMPYPAHS